MGGYVLGVIGGSGLYEIEGLDNRQWVKVSSPWGAPSDEVLMGECHGAKLVFLPRHGRGHTVSPSEINVRANIDVLKRCGVTDILSVNAVGSLREDLGPGDFALVSQYIDRTVRKDRSFFGEGLVGHVSMADPTCPRLTDQVAEAARHVGMKFMENATHVVIEGPQFSTRAESHLFRSWNCDVIGMTAMPEARLAREAELPYANLCMITDYDCWREGEADVDSIIKVMHASAGKARAAIVALARSLPAVREASPIDTVLDTALITARHKWDPDRMLRLDAICKRRFAKEEQSAS